MRVAEEASAAVPAYRRILREIRSRIDSGALKSGDRIESERQLAERWSVSLMTARHALKELEAEGLVRRQIGLGTFVAPPKIHFNRLLSFSEQMASRGVPATSRLTSVQVTEDETEPAARLGLAPGSPLVRLERIRYGGGEPFAFETTYLSHIEFPGLAKAMQGRGSLFEILERDHQLTLAYADEEVDATSADARVAEYLDIPRGSPVLRIRQVLCSSSGRKVLYDVGVYRSERHSLLIRRFR